MPSLETDLLSVLPAGVVPELVVSGSAEGVAVLAVVVGGADHAVLVLQPGVALVLAVGGPRAARVQLTLGCQPADQLVATI